jgi:tetratricopeptide (TPR) repeat protein
MNAGLAIYRIIERIAPAPYANDMLARAALARGDVKSAQSYAQRLPVSATRNELLARIASARGDSAAAQRLFLSAGDVFAIDSDVERLSQRDPRAAYALELQLKTRLEESNTHPDATAQAYWRLGVLAADAGRRNEAMAQYRHAVELSPLSGKFLLSAGFQAYELRMFAEARRDFEQTMRVDPRSADAYAGAGMTALAAGDRVAAQHYAERARSIDPHAHALKTLTSQLQH